MSKNLSQDPITIANASGFPLQIAISNIVKNSTRWQVLLEEHPWRMEETGSEGFIDLVVDNRFEHFVTFVIECKRVRQAAWIFLLSESPSTQISQTTIFGSQLKDSKWKQFGWEAWNADPVTYQSKYCAIPGQNQGRKNLIERSAADVVLSVESLADQERRLQLRIGIPNFSRVYIPVIVTTASLFVAEFDPASILLEDGYLPKNTPISEVSFMRYKKSLTTFGESASAKSINELHKAAERTVFVVNALKFIDFLENCKVKD
jgi:hypothetical protein